MHFDKSWLGFAGVLIGIGTIAAQFLGKNKAQIPNKNNLQR